MAEVESVFASLLVHPRACPIAHREIRRALTQRFPYKIFYIERDDRVVVLAVRHQRQRPQRWLEGL